MLFPEFNETEDFLGLLAFAQVSVGVAEDIGIRVLSEEGEDARCRRERMATKCFSMTGCSPA